MRGKAHAKEQTVSLDLTMSDLGKGQAIRQGVASEVGSSNQITRRPLHRPRGFSSSRIIDNGIRRPWYVESRAHKKDADAVRLGSLVSNFMSFYGRTGAHTMTDNLHLLTNSPKCSYQSDTLRTCKCCDSIHRSAYGITSCSITAEHRSKNNAGQVPMQR